MWPVSWPSRLRLIPVVCVFLLLMLLILQNDINNKDSKVTFVITRLKHPVDTFVFNDDDEGNKMHNAVSTSTHTPTERSTRPPYSITLPGNSIPQYEKKTEERQDGNHVQSEDAVDDKFLREKEKVYSERRRQVEKVCNKLGTTVTFGSVKRASLDRLRWVNSRHFIMCFNAKVGTSSWSRYLLKIVRPNWKGDTHVAAMKNLVPLENRRSSNTLALMEEFGKVMIVRHPFARVLSAYLNKIASKKMLRLTQDILKHYRSPASSSESAIPTLEEFVMYLVNTIPAEDDIRKKAGAHTNIHWRPYYVNCAPCNIHYDIILKMDTIDEDTRYVSHRYDLEVEEILRKNKASNNSSEINAFDLFKTLPRNLTLELYKRYRVDFDMFGYSINPFLMEV